MARSTDNAAMGWDDHTYQRDFDDSNDPDDTGEFLRVELRSVDVAESPHLLELESRQPHDDYDTTSQDTLGWSDSEAEDFYNDSAGVRLVEALRPHLDAADAFVANTMARWTVPVLRVGLGVIFLWFGLLKFFGGMSPAQDLVESTVVELGRIAGFATTPTRLILILLAAWEFTIGVGLLINKARRTVLLMLFLHLPGTALPVFLLPEIVWHTFPLGLTLEGQYIVKNLILVGSALALGSQVGSDDDGLFEDQAAAFEDEVAEVVAFDDAHFEDEVAEDLAFEAEVFEPQGAFYDEVPADPWESDVAEFAQGEPVQYDQEAAYY